MEALAYLWADPDLSKNCRPQVDKIIVSHLGFTVNPRWDISWERGKADTIDLESQQGYDEGNAENQKGGKMSEPTASGFGSRLRELREAAGLSQEALAQRAGMHRFGIAKLERGEREPAWATVRALSRALGVSCAAFESGPDAPAEEAPQPKGRPRKREAGQSEAAPPAKKGKRKGGR